MTNYKQLIDLEIDVKGLKCPLPVLKLKKRIKSLPTGAVVVLLSTDKTVLQDVPAYCDLVGHKILDIETENGIYEFTIKLYSK